MEAGVPACVTLPLQAWRHASTTHASAHPSTALFAPASYKPHQPRTCLAALYAGTAGIPVPVPLSSCFLP